MIALFAFTWPTNMAIRNVILDFLAAILKWLHVLLESGAGNGCAWYLAKTAQCETNKMEPAITRALY